MVRVEVDNFHLTGDAVSIYLIVVVAQHVALVVDGYLTHSKVAYRSAVLDLHRSIADIGDSSIVGRSSEIPSAGFGWCKGHLHFHFLARSKIESYYIFVRAKGVGALAGQ